MKKLFVFLILFALTLPLFAQANENRIARGAEGHLSSLLNNPAMVSPVTATPLGRNWFTLLTDAHVFTDQVSVRQVEAVLTDIDNQIKYFDGKRSRLSAKTVSRTNDQLIVDFVSTSIVIGIRLNTPYRADVKIISTDTTFAKNFTQLAQDSETNREIKNLIGQRYAEEVTINGNTYTYIRMHTISDVNASILPGAKNTLERNAGPTVIEALEALITAAKTK